MALHQRTSGPNQIVRIKKQSIIRKATIGYGIIELLRHAQIVSTQRLITTTTDLAKECTVDNFIVHVSRHVQAITYSEQASWDDIRGISMLSPPLSAQLIEPSFLSNIVDENIQDRMGRYLEVIITAPAYSNYSTIPRAISSDSPASSASNGNDCHSLGVLLYELYSGECPFPTSTHTSSPRRQERIQLPVFCWELQI